MTEYTKLIELIVNDITRVITIPNNNIVLGVVGDIEVNKLMFKMPRYYCGFDMSEFTPKINYVTPNAEGNYYKSELEVTDDVITFTWLLTSDVTEHNGTVKFSISLYKKENGRVSKVFNSRSSVGNVLEGLNVDAYVTPEQQQTILDRLETEIREDIQSFVTEKEASINQQITEKSDAAIKAIDAKKNDVLSTISEDQYIQKIEQNAANVGSLRGDIGNIINTDYRDGYIIDTGGNKLQDDGYKVLKIICYKIKSITFANTVIGNQYVNSVSFYDVKNKFISGIKSDSYSQEVYTANVPDTAYYAVFTCLKSQNVSYRFDTDYVSVFLDRTNEIVRDYQNADNNKLDVIRGKNLFNKNTIIAGKFLYDNGGVGLNNDYFISDYIQIEGGEQYYIQALWTNGASNVFYDLNKNALNKSYSNQTNSGVITAPELAVYIRLSGTVSVVNNVCFSKGTQEIPYEPYTDYKPLNLVEKKVEEFESRFDTFVRGKTELQSTFAQTLSTDDTIDLEVPNIKFGKVISFHANVVSSGEIEISHGQSSWYNSGKIRVDASSVKYYTFTGQDNLEIELQHGLTISNTISISLNVNGVETMENGMPRIADLTVESNGKIFNTRMKWNGCNEKVQAKIISGEYTNCTLNFWSQDYKKDIWAYGDSYFDYWPLLAKKNGYGNFLCDGSSGRASNGALNSLKLGLTHGTPKKILWCMGMNDPDSSTAISAVYKKVIDEVVTLCDELGIELIITTIPNVPDRNHNYKNEYIKSLGKRIVDVSKAIGADDSANWFDGFLSSDKVHPSDTGARAIMSYMITSVPELLN